MTRNHYSVEIRAVPDFESGGYWAYVPMLPGVFGDGETVSEAIQNARDGLKLAIDVYRDDGKPIPWTESELLKDGEHSRRVLIFDS